MHSFGAPENWNGNWLFTQFRAASRANGTTEQRGFGIYMMPLFGIFLGDRSICDFSYYGAYTRMPATLWVAVVTSIDEMKSMTRGYRHPKTHPQSLSPYLW
jgi:hypothetical protein